MIIPGSSNHACSERTRHPNTCDHLRQVWCQSEWNWSIGIQFSSHIINIKLEICDIDQARVLVDVKDLRIQSAQMKNIFHKSSQGKLQSDHLEEKKVLIKYLLLD